MTLPTLTPCTVSDCRAPIAHWHDDGVAYPCIDALTEKGCQHSNTYGPSRCYAPRETATLHLPDVDTVARKVYESDHGPRWADEHEHAKDEYRAYARAVLELIAAHQPVWVEVPKGTLIKAGTRCRREASNGTAFEVIAASDFRSSYGISIDPRTVPAPTLTERIRAACNDSPESRITLDVADVEALLDMVGGDPR